MNEFSQWVRICKNESNSSYVEETKRRRWHPWVNEIRLLLKEFQIQNGQFGYLYLTRTKLTKLETKNCFQLI